MTENTTRTAKQADVDAVARDVDSLCRCDDLGLCCCGAAAARDLLREQYAEIERLRAQIDGGAA